MIKLIKRSECAPTPWKNGRGTTRQMDIFPEEATVKKNDFLWRLSSAEVCGSDPFSSFPECDRLLIVWKGAGLLLNDKELLPNSPIQFSGEEKIHCDLINDKVVDFGLIYKRNQIKAGLNVLSLAPDENLLKLSNALHYLFNASEERCTINQMEMDSGDVLKIQDETELRFVMKGPSLFYLISVELLSSFNDVKTELRAHDS